MGRFHHALSNSEKSAERTCPLDIAVCGFYEVFSVSHTADIARTKQKVCSPTSWLKATEEFCHLGKKPQKTNVCSPIMVFFNFIRVKYSAVLVETCLNPHVSAHPQEIAKRAFPLVPAARTHAAQ
jgi:hypothetical protein